MFTNIGFLRKTGGSRIEKIGKEGNSLSPPKKLNRQPASDPIFLRRGYNRKFPAISNFRGSIGLSESQRETDLHVSHHSSLPFLSPHHQSTRPTKPIRTIPIVYSGPVSTLSRPPALNAHKTNCIFNIYSVDGSGNSKRFCGIGFLVSESLAITTHMIFPAEVYAIRALAAFLDSPTVWYKFDPQRFFFTHKDLKFTLVALVRGDVTEHRTPLPLHHYFTLRESDPIVFYYTRVEMKTVLLLEGEMLCYTAGQDLPPGLPVFDYAWELQGIHHTSTSSYKINQATRVDSIFTFLMSVQHMLASQELDEMLESDPSKRIQRATIPLPVAKTTSIVYWFEWYTRNIYKYDLAANKWTLKQPQNTTTLEALNIWYFYWNSRICYLPNGNIAIVGGASDQKGTIKSDVLIYRPSDNTLHKLPNMFEARESCAVVSTDKQLYVTGGRYPLSTCEAFAYEGFAWSALAPMTYGRYDHSACIYSKDRFLYVSGGLPLENAGRSIEQYDIEMNVWEPIPILLPEAFVRHAIVPLSHKRLAILGGKHTTRVFVLEILAVQGDNHYVPRYAKPGKNLYELLEAEEMENETETVLPAIVDDDRDSVILMTGRDGYAHLKPSLYSKRHFGVLYRSPHNYSPPRVAKPHISHVSILE